MCSEPQSISTIYAPWDFTTCITLSLWYSLSIVYRVVLLSTKSRDSWVIRMINYASMCDWFLLGKTTNYRLVGNWILQSWASNYTRGSLVRPILSLLYHGLLDFPFSSWFLTHFPQHKAIDSKGSLICLTSIPALPLVVSSISFMFRLLCSSSNKLWFGSNLSRNVCSTG